MTRVKYKLLFSAVLAAGISGCAGTTGFDNVTSSPGARSTEPSVAEVANSKYDQPKTKDKNGVTLPASRLKLPKGDMGEATTEQLDVIAAEDGTASGVVYKTKSDRECVALVDDTQVQTLCRPSLKQATNAGQLVYSGVGPVQAPPEGDVSGQVAQLAPAYVWGVAPADATSVEFRQANGQVASRVATAKNGRWPGFTGFVAQIDIASLDGGDVVAVKSDGVAVAVQHLKDKPGK